MTDRSVEVDKGRKDLRGSREASQKQENRRGDLAHAGTSKMSSKGPPFFSERKPVPAHPVACPTQLSRALADCSYFVRPLFVDEL